MLMIMNRAQASPHVSSVKGAVWIKVRSIDEAQLLLHECIDHGVARWLRD